MILLIGKLIELVEGFLDHFVNVVGDFTLQPDFQWTGYLSANLTQKGDESVGALSTVIHMGLMFFAQLMLVLMGDFYNVAAPVG